MKYELPAFVVVCGGLVLACAGGQGAPPLGEAGGAQESTASGKPRPARERVGDPGPQDPQVIGNGESKGTASGSNTNWIPGEAPPRGREPQRPRRLPPEPIDPEDPRVNPWDDDVTPADERTDPVPADDVTPADPAAEDDATPSSSGAPRPSPSSGSSSPSSSSGSSSSSENGTPDPT